MTLTDLPPSREKTWSSKVTTNLQSKRFRFKFNSSYQYLLLTIIVGIAAVLRFYKLGEWSFWWDEMFTLRDATNPFQNGLSRIPISFALTHIALNQFGVSEWSARFIPALVGVISLPLLYFPIRKIFNVSTALVATLLLAIAPWHIYWSQSARFYSTMLLFYSLALLFFHLGLEKDRPSYLLASLVMLGLAANERLSALLFVPVVVCYVSLVFVLPIEKPSGLNLRNLIIFLVPGFIGGLFFSWKFVQQPAKWFNIFGWTNNNPVWLLAGVVYYVSIPVICMALLASLYLLVKGDRAGLLFSLGAVIPLLVVMILSLFQYTANRYIFISLTSWLILASVAVTELFHQTPKNSKLLAVGVLAILILVPLSENALYYKYQNGNRDDWKGAFALVNQRKEQDDLVVSSNKQIGNYYLMEGTISMENLDLGKIEGSTKRVWFVEDMNVEPKWPWMHDWLQKNAHLVANFDTHVRARNFKMRVYIYDPASMAVSPVSRERANPR